MDDRERQMQVKEGAGLEESRLNTEFIAWLQKWSTPALLVVVVVIGIYAINQRVQMAAQNRRNTAFQEYTASAPSLAGPASWNPETIRRVAEEYDGVRGVGMMARLDAADAYMAAIVRGLMPGSSLNPDGTVQNESDLLSEDDVERYLSQAESLYREVRDTARGNTDRAIHELSALFGLAAVAETRGEVDAARGFYEEAASLARNMQFAHEKVALARIESLDQLTELPRLYDTAELPIPEIEEPVLPEAPTTEGADGDVPAEDADVPADGADATEEAPADPADDAADDPTADDGEG